MASVIEVGARRGCGAFKAGCRLDVGGRAPFDQVTALLVFVRIMSPRARHSSSRSPTLFADNCSAGETLLRKLGIGLVVGIVGAWLARSPLRQLTDPRETQPIVALAAAGLIFGVAAAAHGSGFLAVFVAGLLSGDADAPIGDDVRAFHSELAKPAEVVVFGALGLTVHLAGLQAGVRASLGVGPCGTIRRMPYVASSAIPKLRLDHRSGCF